MNSNNQTISAWLQLADENTLQENIFWRNFSAVYPGLEENINFQTWQLQPSSQANDIIIVLETILNSWQN